MTAVGARIYIYYNLYLPINIIITIVLFHVWSLLREELAIQRANERQHIGKIDMYNSNLYYFRIKEEEETDKCHAPHIKMSFITRATKNIISIQYYNRN